MTGTWEQCGGDVSIYKGVNEGNIQPSMPLTHTTTHTFREPSGRSPQEILNVVNSE